MQDYQENKDKVLLQDPLSLEIDDKELVEILETRLKKNEDEFESKYHLK